MSEKLSSNESKEIQVSVESDVEQLKTIEKKLELESAEAEKKHSGEKLKAKQEIEQAISGAEKPPVNAERSDAKAEPVSKGAKKQQYKATMRRVESKLPSYQKTFSKFIHTPIVDNISNVAGKTVARPSGLLGGSIAAAVGLTVLYFNAKNINFEYPAGAAFIFFASIGWLAGLLIEYIVNAVKRFKD